MQMNVNLISPKILVLSQLAINLLFYMLRCTLDKRMNTMLGSLLFAFSCTSTNEVQQCRSRYQGYNHSSHNESKFLTKMFSAPKVKRNNPSASFIHFFLYGLIMRNKAPKGIWNTNSGRIKKQK